MLEYWNKRDPEIEVAKSFHYSIIPPLQRMLSAKQRPLKLPWRRLKPNPLRLYSLFGGSKLAVWLATWRWIERVGYLSYPRVAVVSIAAQDLADSGMIDL